MKRNIYGILIVAFLLPGLIFAAPHKMSESQSQQTQMQVKEKSEMSVDINTADEAMLITLKGMSRKKAKAIIAYRKNHDPFTSAADLTKVRGFSKKKVDKMMEMNKGRISFERKTDDNRKL